jgi:hypothetical protein
MKEITQVKKDEVTAVAEIPVENKEVFQGRQRLFAGQKCWQINGKTFEVEEAKYEVEAVKFEDAAVNMAAPKRKVLMQKGHWYVVALNKKNALRKLDKMIRQMQAVASQVQPETEA